jgi:hypothetical protein
VSSSTALASVPLDERTAAMVVSAPVAVVIDRLDATPGPTGRRLSVWPPAVAVAVSIAPGASEEMATAPSIKTSTGKEYAFTTRSPLVLVEQQAVGWSLPHAARAAIVSRGTTHARTRMADSV